MNIQVPEGWRKGQTIFNFLEWLGLRGYDNAIDGRMADPFHIPDKEFDRLYEEFLKGITSLNKRKEQSMGDEEKKEEGTETTTPPATDESAS